MLLEVTLLNPLGDDEVLDAELSLLNNLLESLGATTTCFFFVLTPLLSEKSLLPSSLLPLRRVLVRSLIMLRAPLLWLDLSRSSELLAPRRSPDEFKLVREP